MQEELNKKISQFVDHELDLQQNFSLISDVKQHADLKSKLNRYQVIGQVLKNDQVVVLREDFAERIAQQIQHEPVYFLPSQTHASLPWKRTAMALAASFLVMAVMLPNFINQSKTGPESESIIAQQQAVLDIQPTTASATAKLEKSKAGPQRTQNQRFKDYLLAHSNSIYTIGASNYQPYARVARYAQE